ncbi:MAG: TIGR02996 domain-containing protein [Gemmataceae bacterium]|nr:TIGR02996 domain-containing protein [Gemmataceae bacterium]
MTDEAALLAAIGANPDDDTVRLALADFYDEHDRAQEAELIRVQVELEPVRDKYEIPRAAELHQREEELARLVFRRDWEWLDALVGRSGIGVDYRRGLPDALLLPARWFVEHGAVLRTRFPTLRRLVVFRLNGWGPRFAASPHLKGIRELELPCWYADADAEALASSPHLSDLEVLHYWRGRGHNDDVQIRTLARSPSWPRLRKLRVMLGYPEDRELVNVAAGRPIGEAYNPTDDDLFPFAADFDHLFFVGKLPDGTQFFAFDYGACYHDSRRAPSTEPFIMTTQLFDPAGNPTTTQDVVFPPELIYPTAEEMGNFALSDTRDAERRQERERLLRERFGWRPAFIRVKEFSLDGFQPFWDESSYLRGYSGADHPDDDLRTDYHGPLGGTSAVYWRATGAEFNFSCGDVVWLCDKSGQVRAT